jgi:hypothetical protein
VISTHTFHNVTPSYFWVAVQLCTDFG